MHAPFPPWKDDGSFVFYHLTPKANAQETRDASKQLLGVFSCSESCTRRRGEPHSALWLTCRWSAAAGRLRKDFTLCLRQLKSPLHRTYGHQRGGAGGRLCAPRWRPGQCSHQGAEGSAAASPPCSVRQRAPPPRARTGLLPEQGRKAAAWWSAAIHRIHAMCRKGGGKKAGRLRIGKTTHVGDISRRASLFNLCGQNWYFHCSPSHQGIWVPDLLLR